jgi:hypothetical protein
MGAWVKCGVKSIESTGNEWRVRLGAIGGVDVDTQAIGNRLCSQTVQG